MINSLFYRIRQHGFTLIELMLVIIIISIITLYGTTQLRNNAHQKLLENTKVEIQNWLVALGNYYIAKKQWPSSVEDVINNNDITVASLCSSWEGTGAGDCLRKSQYQLICPDEGCNPIDNRYMGIQLKLLDKNSANDLVSLLPSAKLIEQDKSFIVAAFTPIPAVIAEELAVASRQWGWIASAGEIQSSHQSCIAKLREAKIKLPKCGNGYEGHYIQFFLRQRTGRLRPAARGVPVPPAAVCINPRFLNTFSKCCIDYTGTNYWVDLRVGNNNGLNSNSPSINANISGTYTNGHWNYQYSYFMTFCIPKGSWDPSGANGQNSSGDPRQCAGNWSTYNNTRSC